MIDAEDLRFIEHRRDPGIDRFGAGKVMADRFFQHHPCAGTGKIVLTQCLADRLVETRRSAQVVEDVAIAHGGDAFAQHRHRCGILHARGLVVQAPEETLDGGRIRAGLRIGVGQAFAHRCAEAGIVHLAAAAAEDAQSVGQQVAGVECAQGGSSIRLAKSPVAPNSTSKVAGEEGMG